MKWFSVSKALKLQTWLKQILCSNKRRGDINHSVMCLKYNSEHFLEPQTRLYFIDFHYKYAVLKTASLAVPPIAFPQNLCSLKEI